MASPVLIDDPLTAERTAQIRDIAADLFSVEPEEVEEAESFLDDLGADSLLAIELLTQLEKHFKVRIDESEVPGMTTLKGTYDIVAQSAGW